jgi:hypothetical protein
LGLNKRVFSLSLHLHINYLQIEAVSVQWLEPIINIDSQFLSVGLTILPESI